MFYYDKINITDITKSEPIGIIRDVLVIGTSLINDHVEEFYFKLDAQIMKTTHHSYSTKGYMHAKIPLRLLNDMYLYIGISDSEEKAMFFIEPKLYKLMSQDEISSLVLKSTSPHITGEVNHNLPEPLKEFYLPELIYYELAGPTKDKFGHQYITEPLIHMIARDKNDFHKYFDYIIHREPLIFYLNRKQLIFISTEDLRTGMMRLLQTDNEGVLFELNCFHKDDSEEIMQHGGNSSRDSMRMDQIKNEVERLMPFDFI